MTDVDIANMALVNKLGSAKITALSDRDDINLSYVYNQVRAEVLRIYPWRFAQKRSRVTASGLLNCSTRTISFIDSNPDTITDSNSGFINAGFRAGEIVAIEGSGSNDGEYGIASVSANTLTLETYEKVTPQTLVNNSDLKLYARPSNMWNYKYSPPSDYLEMIAVNDITIYDQPNWDMEDGFIVTNEIDDNDQITVRYISDVSNPDYFPPQFITCFVLKLAAELAIPITNDKVLKDALLREFNKMVLDLLAIEAGRSHADETRPLTSWQKAGRGYADEARLFTSWKKS